MSTFAGSLFRLATPLEGRQIAASSAAAIELASGTLNSPVLATVPSGLDADACVLLSLGADLGEPGVARALRAGATIRDALDATLGPRLRGRSLIVEGLDNLTDPARASDLGDLLEPRSRDVAAWLKTHAALELVAPRFGVSPLGLEPKPRTDWDANALWTAVERDPERFVLAFARRRWLGEITVERTDAASLVIDVWHGLPPELRRLVALLVVHARPLPTALVDRLALFRPADVDLACESGLVERPGGALRLSAPWYKHAPVTAKERGGIHRTLADAFASCAIDDTAEAGLATLEAHRHFVEVPDLDRARAYAKFGALWLLDHARRRSEVGEFAVASREYGAVLDLDAAAQETAARVLGARGRGYALHYLHFNRAKDGAEPIQATLAGYEEALNFWPEHALFWSRTVRSKFLVHDWQGALRSLTTAYDKVPDHRKRDPVLIVRTAERLAERGAFVPAVLVATERALADADLPIPIDRLWARVAAGVPVDRVWTKGAPDVVAPSASTLTLGRGADKRWTATWLGVSAEAAAPRGALAALTTAALRVWRDAVEAPGAPAANVGLLSSADGTEEARWATAIAALHARVATGEMKGAQLDCVLAFWRAVADAHGTTRRPAIGRTEGGDYYLSWAFEGAGDVATVEIDDAGGHSWFWRDADGKITHGDGTAAETLAALDRAFRVFARTP